MIPYFQWTHIQLGPLTLQVWGLFVALGILVGLWIAARRADKQGLDKGIVYDAGTWIMLGAFLGARILHIVGYEFSTYLADPMEVFRVWHGGFSSVGGFIGAVLVGVWYLRRKHVDVYKYADVMIFGLPIGLAIGRIGCFFIHDHPGTASDFVLAVQQPDGTSQHDHGLYLSINGFLLAGLFWWLSRKKRPLGTYIAVFLTWYGAMRFFLDFYRTVDATYLGLTPAQYVSLVMFIAGAWLSVSLLRGSKRDKVS